jgi:disulfide bond formation protein DsbB
MGRMNSDAVQTFSALLSFVALAAGVITFASLAVNSAWSATWLATVRQYGVWAICAITSTAMIGSLYFSESVGYAPCKLCWYQRIAMYSIAIISFVAALRKDNGIARYTVVLAPIGLLVSTYHYLLEWGVINESSVCSLDVPCTSIWFREFGFVTLCFMAGTAFIATIAFSIALMRTSTPVSEED